MSLFENLSVEEFYILVKNNPQLVHELNDDGETPLFVQTKLPYIRILAENGANLTHQNKYGDTVLHQSGNRPECIRYLLRKANFYGIENNEGDCVEDIDEIIDSFI